MKYIRKDKVSKPYTPADVLQIALEKEKSSYEFYVEMIKVTANPAMLKLLNELKNAEWGHILKIQHRLDK